MESEEKNFWFSSKQFMAYLAGYGLFLLIAVLFANLNGLQWAWGVFIAVAGLAFGLVIAYLARPKRPPRTFWGLMAMSLAILGFVFYQAITMSRTEPFYWPSNIFLIGYPLTFLALFIFMRFFKR